MKEPGESAQPEGGQPAKVGAGKQLGLRAGGESCPGRQLCPPTNHRSPGRGLVCWRELSENRRGQLAGWGQQACVPARGVTLSLLLHPPLFPGLGAHRVLEEMRLWAPTSSVQRPPAGGRDA